jgi:hypothetical protein
MSGRILWMWLIALIWGGLLSPPWLSAQQAPDIDNLISSFPSLDELENRLGAGETRSLPERNREVPASSTADATGYQPVTAGPPVFLPTSVVRGGVDQRGGDSLTSAYAHLTDTQKKAVDLGYDIRRLNDRAANKYFNDRLTFNARTDFGTAVTGLFVGGLGFGTQTASFKQSYMAGYNLPLLARYQTSTDWKRALSGWQFSSAVGVQPNVADAFSLRRFLGGTQLSWTVAFTYDISGATLRRIRDRQYSLEADQASAVKDAVRQRDDLLKHMVERVEAMNRPAVRDTRLEALREIYPQYELHLSRYRRAKSCDERIEHFFTMKGVALSLLTLADYDRAGAAGQRLIAAWKSARQLACENDRIQAGVSTPAF